MALFYLVGGLTGALVLVLPHPHTLNVAVLVVCSGTASLIGMAVYPLRRWLPPAAYLWLLAVGTGIVTVLVATAGSASASVSFSFIYIWVVFYALLFLPRLGLTVQIAVAAAAYLTAVAFFERSGAYSFTALEPVLLVTVLGTASAVVTMLSRACESSESIR